MRRIVSVLLAAALAAASARLAAAEEQEPASCLSCHAAAATKEGAPEGRRVDPAQRRGLERPEELLVVASPLVEIHLEDRHASEATAERRSACATPEPARV